jgi:2,5-diamino-6-(ribosylamino)-4(3H)-pyrimidinone 5'-phosphate reductase
MKYELAINMAMTLDGKVARPDGKWYGLCSKEDRILMDVYRSQAEVLIVGKNSILNDNPVVKVTYVENAKSPRPVVLIGHGTISNDRNLFTDSKCKPIIFCLKTNYPEIAANLYLYADIQILDGDTIDPKQVLSKLLEMGYTKILLEGGPRLNYSFFQEGLINKIHITLVPFIIGMKTLPALLDGDKQLAQFDKNKWKLESVQQNQDEIFLTYISVG